MSATSGTVRWRAGVALGTISPDHGGGRRFRACRLRRLRQILEPTVTRVASNGTVRHSDDARFGRNRTRRRARCHGALLSSPRAGAASGLTRSVRGGGADPRPARTFPFDGTQFPPSPWGGARVAEPDIQLIEGWIAAGCPSPEEDSAPADTVAAAAAPACAQRWSRAASGVHRIRQSAGP